MHFDCTNIVEQFQSFARRAKVDFDKNLESLSIHSITSARNGSEYTGSSGIRPKWSRRFENLFSGCYKYCPCIDDRESFNPISALFDTTSKIVKYFCTWGLKINPRKMKAIAFTRTYQELQQKITVSRTEIEWSGKIEYLGMILNK
ncbi:hypothetical protein Trydic_g9549 [Trypoxylus dichotomus]